VSTCSNFIADRVAKNDQLRRTLREFQLLDTVHSLDKASFFMVKHCDELMLSSNRMLC
jgi:hypothetical protein